jgi:DNA-binding transcriptional LysR family regulator
VLASVDELWRQVRSHGLGERGRVIVAYGASASYETAPRLLGGLAERHPEVEIQTSVKAVEEIVTGLGEGTLDAGIVRCPPGGVDLEHRTIRHERQGALLREGHPLAGGAAVALGDLAGTTILMHAREANPSHYDAIVELCRAAGFEPTVELRTVSFDLAYSAVAGSDAVVILGESACVGLPAGLRWLPLEPAVTIEVGLLARRHNRSPIVDRMLETAPAIAADLGWL